MISRVRYAAALIRLRRNDFAPIITCFVLLGVGFTLGQGDVLAALGRASTITFAFGTWFVMAVTSAGAGTHRAIMAAHVGGTLRILVAEIVLVLGIGLVLCGLGTAVPAFYGDFAGPAESFLVGGAACVGALISGVVLGLWCSALLWKNRILWRAIAFVLVVALTCIPGAPGPRTLMGWLATHDAHQSTIMVLVYLLASIAALALSIRHVDRVSGRIGGGTQTW